MARFGVSEGGCCTLSTRTRGFAGGLEGRRSQACVYTRTKNVGNGGVVKDVEIRHDAKSKRLIYTWCVFLCIQSRKIPNYGLVPGVGKGYD